MTAEDEPPGPEQFRVRGFVPEAVHVYRDEQAAPVGAAVRFAPGTLDPERKTILMYRYEGGQWVAGLNGMQLPLYRLPEIVTAIARGEIVLIVEGEKCADRMALLGPCATTNAFGAGKWEERYATVFAGAHVVLLTDNNDLGRRHMQQVALSVRSTAASVRMVELPGLPPGGDVVDWNNAGGTREQLIELTENTPLWSPPVSVGEELDAPIAFGVSAEAKPFPIADGLPRLLREVATQVAETVKVDPAAPALLSGVAVSAAAGNIHRVRVSDAHAEPCLSRYGLWTCPSGERKTSTFATVFRPFDNWMRDEEPAYKTKKARQQADACFYRRRAEHAEGRGAKASDSAAAQEWLEKARTARASIPPLPRRPIAYVTDATQEALVRLMAANGGASAVAAGEARHVGDALLGRHRQDGGTDDSVYLRAHGGDRIDRARVGNTAEGEFLGIDRPALAIGICMQPDKLDDLAGRPELTASGFLPRCNIVYPKSLVGERIESGTETPMDSATAEEWEQCLRAIITERFRHIDSGVASPWSPVELCLDPEAMELRRAFANEIETRQRPTGDLHAAGGFASKAAGEAARLAALFHLVDLSSRGRLWEANTILIPAATWMLAETSQRYHLDESLRVLSLAREDIFARKARRILDWASRSPAERRVLATRDLIASRIAESTDDAEELFGWLEDRRWLRKHPPCKGQQAARWEVHPAVFDGGQQ